MRYYVYDSREIETPGILWLMEDSVASFEDREEAERLRASLNEGWLENNNFEGIPPYKVSTGSNY